MSHSNNNILFIGYKYPYGNPKFGKSLDVYMFVDALSKVVGKKVHTYYYEENGKETDEIIKFCESIKPNYIFFNLIKDEISKDCLSKLKNKFKTINWFGDDQWRFESFSSKMSEYFTHSITTDKFSVSKYRKLGRNVILSQWAAIDFENIVNENNKSEFIYDVSFVGGYSYTREWLIEYLRENGIVVNVFGNGWEAQNKFLEYDEISKIFRNTKINLNLSNSVPKDLDFIKYFLKKYLKNIVSIKNLKTLLKSIKFFFTYKKSNEQIKARNFEIPISGGFQISNYPLCLEDFMEIGKEVIVFNTKEELLALVKYYLNNQEERHLIRNTAYKNAKKNIYEERFKNILKQL